MALIRHPAPVNVVRGLMESRVMASKDYNGRNCNVKGSRHDGKKISMMNMTLGKAVRTEGCFDFCNHSSWLFDGKAHVRFLPLHRIKHYISAYSTYRQQTLCSTSVYP